MARSQLLTIRLFDSGSATIGNFLRLRFSANKAVKCCSLLFIVRQRGEVAAKDYNTTLYSVQIKKTSHIPIQCISGSAAIALEGLTPTLAVSFVATHLYFYEKFLTCHYYFMPLAFSIWTVSPLTLAFFIARMTLSAFFRSTSTNE